MSNRKKSAQPMYGVTLNVFPAGKPTKRIVIHKYDCGFYQKARRGSTPRKYTFAKNAVTLRAALKWAVKKSLDWHAEIVLCGKCIKSGKTIFV